MHLAGINFVRFAAKICVILVSELQAWTNVACLRACARTVDWRRKTRWSCQYQSPEVAAVVARGLCTKAPDSGMPSGPAPDVSCWQTCAVMRSPRGGLWLPRCRSNEPTHRDTRIPRQAKTTNAWRERKSSLSPDHLHPSVSQNHRF